MIYVVEYKIDGRWQRDGEWFGSLKDARDQAGSNWQSFAWPWRIRKAAPYKKIVAESVS